MLNPSELSQRTVKAVNWKYYDLLIRPADQGFMSKVLVPADDKPVKESLSLSVIEDLLGSEINLHDQDLTNTPIDWPSSNFSEIKSTLLENALHGQTDPADQIKRVTHHEDIFDLLDLAKQHQIANRLRYLHEITQDDGPDDPAMKFMSLREFALFFVGDGNWLPYPQVGISPNGSLQAEWRSRKASAVMKFLSDGNTRFAGTMTNQGSRKTIQGSGPKRHALQSILPFINHTYDLGHA